MTWKPAAAFLAIQKAFTETGEYPQEFSDGYNKYARCNKTRDFVKQSLDIQLKIMYVSPEMVRGKLIYANSELDLSGETMYMVTKTGKVVCLNNSEWGGLIRCGTVK